MAELRPLIDKLQAEQILSHDEFVRLFTCRNPEDSEYMRALAQETATENYGHDIYLRGLIEFTNYCRKSSRYYY